MGYRRAITNIKTFKKPITSAEQMDQIPFVGEGIKKKVAEGMTFATVMTCESCGYEALSVMGPAE